MSFIDLLKVRHSQYDLGRNIKDPEVVIKKVKETMRLTPTGFNAQTGRLLIITGDAQDKLWGQIIPQDLKAEMDRQGVSAESWLKTESKLKALGAAFGTILFYEDQSIIKKLQNDFSLYADNFQNWSEQVTGSAQLNAWLALTEMGLGANLQHYNPVIDKSVATEWKVPDNWLLRGELLFGSVEKLVTDAKEQISDDERFMVVKE